MPTFLGIGAQKSGTTWLHARLNEHPEIYVPHARKEIHFFDAYYYKGLDWYSSFFPNGPLNEGYAQWGEITPKYIYDPVVAERIHEVIGDQIKLIVMLRDPVERLFSQYRMSYSQGDTNFDPEEFFETNEEAFARGLYSVQLKRFFSLFKRENILILFYEEVFRDTSATAKALSQVEDFLKINNQLWEQQRIKSFEGNLGSAGRPKAFGLYRFAKRVRQWCMDHDLEGAVRAVKSIGVNNATFGGLQGTPKPSFDLKKKVWRSYHDEVQALESMLGRSIPFWGPEFWQG